MNKNSFTFLKQLIKNYYEYTKFCLMTVIIRSLDEYSNFCICKRNVPVQIIFTSINSMRDMYFAMNIFLDGLSI